MIDNINHPKHYNNSNAKCECGRRIECIDITRHMGFDIGNVIKYLWRAADKNGLEDLKKAQWYLNDAIKLMEQKEIENAKAPSMQLPSCKHGLVSHCNECDGCQHVWADNLLLSMPPQRQCVKCKKTDKLGYMFGESLGTPMPLTNPFDYPKEDKK